MDWKDVGKSVLKVAPLIGGILGGPAAGMGVATVANMVASFIGVEATPEKVMEAITQDSQKLLEVKILETQHRTELIRIQSKLEEQRIVQETQRIMTINETMRAEAKSEHWPQWFWRPFWGLSSGTAFLVVCIFVCYLGYQAIIAKDANAMGMIPLVIGSFTTLFGVPAAILGIAAWHRGKEKRAMLGDTKT